MLIKVLQVPDKVKKLVLGWLSHIVFLHFSNEVEQPDQQNQTRPRKQSKVKGSTPFVRFSTSSPKWFDGKAKLHFLY